MFRDRTIATILIVMAAALPLPAQTIPSNGASQPAPIPESSDPIVHLPTSQLPTFQLPKPGSSELRKIKVDPSQASSLATKLSLRFRDVPGITITPDVTQGQLIVLAPPAVHAEIVDSLDVFAKNMPKADQVRLSLKNTSSAIFEKLIIEMSSRPLATTTRSGGNVVVLNLAVAGLPSTSIEIDRNRSEVVISAPQDQITAWRQAVAFIDQSPLSSEHSIRMVRIERSGPAPIQRAVRLLGLADGSTDNTQTADTHQPKWRKPRVVARTVAFPQQGDAAGGNAAGNGGGDAKAQSPADNAEGETVPGAGLFGDVQIEFVPQIGQVIIKGSQKDIDRVREVIRQIEEQSEVTKPDVQVVQLQHVDSTALAALLKQIYDDVLSARQGQVSVTALDTPNALLLIGRTEAIGGVMDLIKKLDVASDESSRLRVYRLQHASASDAEETIRDFFVAKPGEDDDDRPGLGTRVRVEADYRTNSLIVQASPRDLEEVSKLIKDLDVLETPAESQLKVIPLSNASAETLAEVITEAIAGEGASVEDLTTPSSTLSILSVDSEAGTLLKSGALLGAVVTADLNSNSLVVRAPATSMPLISELVRQLDKAPGVESLVKVFTIENGDAVQLSTSLTDLFGDNASTEGTSVGAGNLGGLPPATANGESSLVPLRFSTDQRSNSIIASGSAEDLEVVESILLRLDTAGFAERITEVVWLRHQSSNEIAIALETYIQQRTQTSRNIQQFQQGLSAYDLVDRDLIVVSEPITNSLLISVSPRLYEDVRRLIDQMDRRQPMVMIKVLIAEVNLDDGFEIGGEVGLQDSLLFNRSVANSAIAGIPATPNNSGFGFNNNGSPNLVQANRDNVASRGVSTFGLGTASDSFGYGGFVLSAASESVSLLFRTLQNADRLQILSRPQVMTLDNTEALVQVGRTIARVTGIQNNGVNGSQVATQDVEVGLILRVRPRVGSDGLIVLDIDATRSERDPTSGTAIPTGDGGIVQVDDIIRTTAQSVIAAYSGQTVVFGGLIQKSRQNTSRRVPYLADIPLIGVMFKFDREVERRTELLVVMTPQLVTGEEDLEYIKQVESSRMSWCLADVVEMNGDVGLSGGYGLWGPATGATIYPDVQPTIDSFENCMPQDSSITYPIENDPYQTPAIDATEFQNAIPESSVPQSSVPQASVPDAVPSPPFTKADGPVTRTRSKVRVATFKSLLSQPSAVKQASGIDSEGLIISE
jgi:general secretion pathway protein D